VAGAPAAAAQSQVSRDDVLAALKVDQLNADYVIVVVAFLLTALLVLWAVGAF